MSAALRYSSSILETSSPTIFELDPSMELESTLFLYPTVYIDTYYTKGRAHKKKKLIKVKNNNTKESDATY